MSKNYISPSMMPMDAIAQYMETVAKFGKKTDSSADTKNVSGVKSSLIAKAATNQDGSLVRDRETVKNALQLGGVPANQYVTTEGANALLADTHSVAVNTGDEIKNLRDELYQMKAELIKSGMLKTIDCYNGFIDGFKEGNEKYINKAITVVNTDISSVSNSFISVEDTSDFIAGEYIVINTNEPQIVRIQDIASSTRLNLSSNVAGPIPTGTGIYKTYGSYNNGAFVFGKKKDVSISSKERYIILNDDAQPLLLTKQYTPNSGYAAQINIPSTAKGAIKKVGVQAKVTGYPGGLKCYVIDPSNNATDITSLSTIEELRKDGKIVGESDLLYASQATGAFNELYFEFPKTVVLDKSKYVFLFVQINADNNNYWELKGLKGENGMDLQTNSKLYNFSEGAGFRTEDGDLYLVVVTSEILLNKVEYAKQGLYSADFSLANTTKATRVRVELKINREGRFKVVDNPNTLVPNANRPLNTYNEDNKSYSTNLFNTGDTVIIGNQIAKVGTSRTANTSFSLAKETYAPAGADVYRVGYKVLVKAFNENIDFNNINHPIKRTATTLIELPLTAVMLGKEAGQEDISSDRLIFEGEIKLDSHTGYKLQEFNHIETQIFWSNEAATKLDLNNSPELAGKILDVTISTDNTYNKRNK